MKDIPIITYGNSRSENILLSHWKIQTVCIRNKREKEDFCNESGIGIV